jgi:probable rRNA maturation factor
MTRVARKRAPLPSLPQHQRVHTRPKPVEDGRQRPYGRAMRGRVREGAPAIEIMVESARWKAKRNTKALLQRAIAAAAAAVPTRGGEVAILLTDDKAIRVLNRDWRQKNTPTNVLSFPAQELRATHGTRRLLGDIVIAYETTEREARAEHKPFAHHLAHLAVHGFLHLLGYDHVADDEAQAMEGLETSILARLGVPDPYIAR